MLDESTTFAFNLLATLLTPLVFWSYPQLFPYFMIVLLLPLLLYRYVTFKAQKLHFYLVEFCIYFNVSTYLHTLICLPMTENSPQLCNVWLKSNFVHANGPVLLALFGFRFKLKFANMRQMTSCALHLMPAMNYYLLKWNSNMVQHGLLTTTIQQDFLSLGEQFVYPLIFYLVWQLLHFGIHYVIIFEDKSLRTIMREKNFLQNHPVVKLFMRIGLVQQGVPFDPDNLIDIFKYSLCQFICTLVGLVPTYFMYNHRWINNLFLISTASYIAWYK